MVAGKNHHRNPDHHQDFRCWPALNGHCGRRGRHRHQRGRPGSLGYSQSHRPHADEDHPHHRSKGQKHPSEGGYPFASFAVTPQRHNVAHYSRRPTRHPYQLVTKDQAQPSSNEPLPHITEQNPSRRPPPRHPVHIAGPRIVRPLPSRIVPRIPPYQKRARKRPPRIPGQHKPPSPVHKPTILKRAKSPLLYPRSRRAPTPGRRGGGPAQGARRPDSMEDGGLGRDRTRQPAEDGRPLR